MPSNTQSRHARLRVAGLLVIAGLAIQMATIAWTHPLAFLAFLGVGTPLVAAGVLLYLFSLPGIWSAGPDDWS